jgi:membrane protease YdiL (CAAX protease family)
VAVSRTNRVSGTEELAIVATDSSAASVSGSRSRIEPSVTVGIAVVIAYMVIITALQATSGIGYTEFFASAANAVRTAVIPLAVCSVLLLAFVAWARWDSVWRDPARLPMSGLLWTVLVLFVVTIVVRLAGITWGEVPADLLLASFASGALVGLAEELLFRGVFLRCMRTERRPEAAVALWTAIAFGMFHLPNIFTGVGALGLAQLVLAAISGVALYLFRRASMTILVAMAAHGIWDISTFLSINYSAELVGLLAFALNAIGAIIGLVALVVIARRDRDITVTSVGVVATTG